MKHNWLDILYDDIDCVLVSWCNQCGTVRTICGSLMLYGKVGEKYETESPYLLGTEKEPACKGE